MTEKSEQQKASFAVMKLTAKATDAKIRSGASDQGMEDYAAMVRKSGRRRSTNTWKNIRLTGRP